MGKEYDSDLLTFICSVSTHLGSCLYIITKTGHFDGWNSWFDYILNWIDAFLNLLSYRLNKTIKWEKDYYFHLYGLKQQKGLANHVNMIQQAERQIWGSLTFVMSCKDRKIKSRAQKLELEAQDSLIDTTTAGWNLLSQPHTSECSHGQKWIL